MRTLSPIELQTIGLPDNSQIRVSGNQPLSDLGKTSFDTVGQVQFIPSFSYMPCIASSKIDGQRSTVRPLGQTVVEGN